MKEAIKTLALLSLVGCANMSEQACTEAGGRWTLKGFREYYVCQTDRGTIATSEACDIRPVFYCRRPA